MPRKLRLEYPGAIHHVMSRANGKGNLLETDVDQQDFVKTLAETGANTGFQVAGNSAGMVSGSPRLQGQPAGKNVAQTR
jgi:hypothetical protein